MTPNRIALDIKKANGETLYTNFSNQELGYFSKPDEKRQQYRVATFPVENLSCRVVVYSEDLIKSSRIFKHFVNSLTPLLSFLVQNLRSIETKTDVEMRRLQHNIVTYNGLALQEIEFLIPPDKLMKNDWGEKMNFVRKQVAENKKEAAEALLKIAKYNQGIKSEISIFRKLFVPNPELKLQSHVVSRVIMNTLHFFFPDLTDIGVHVTVARNDEIKAYFDYESISVALYHFFDNTSKYCLPEKKIEVSMTDLGKQVRISIQMQSLRIEDTEQKQIFTEGYSGVHARKAKKNGSGVGMYLVKKLVELNRGYIEIKSERSINEKHQGLLYEMNIFTITLPTSAREP